MLQHARATGRRHTIRTDIIFDRQRHSGQSMSFSPHFELVIQLLRLPIGRVFCLGNKSLHLRFYLADPEKIGAHDLRRSHFPCRKFLMKFDET